MVNDPFKDLYDEIAERKGEANAIGPYSGGNGRVDRAVDIIFNEDFPRSGVIVDVGGATGNLGYALRNHFDERITIDISEACRTPNESKGNRFVCANVDNVGLDNIGQDVVDLVVALDFVEHILDPQHFARECSRVLHSGGKVLINTPNIQFWKHLHSLVVEGVFPHTSGDLEVYHGGHVAFYNMQDMVEIFEGAGFVDCRMHTRGLTPEPPPPIWVNLFRPSNKNTAAPSIQLSYPDLIFSCKKL